MKYAFAKKSGALLSLLLEGKQHSPLLEILECSSLATSLDIRSG